MKFLAQINIPAPQPLQNFVFFGRDRSNPFFSDRLIGDLVSKGLQYAIVIAGLIFFVKLVSAGFSYLTSAGDSGKIQAATKDITNALIGLILVISVFFIKQILVVLFGIKI